MPQRFLAGILSSFVFIFGAALFFFQDLDMVLPLAMFTFPAVFCIGLPMSWGIDILMRPCKKFSMYIVFIIEAALYGIAGISATFLLFWSVFGKILLVMPTFLFLGAMASCIYFLFLYWLRAKERAGK
ncbi:MAG: hypothetical protein ACM32O_14865 [Clostridia bacterium]